MRAWWRPAIFASVFLILGCGEQSEDASTTKMDSNLDDKKTAVTEPAEQPPVAVKQDFLATLDLDAAGCDEVRAKRTLNQCKACHSVDPNDGHSTGPNLFGIYDQEAGKAEGFRYSPVLRDSGIVWNNETLDAFLKSPQKYLKGNRMAFGGVRNDQNRSAMVCLLEALQ